jgi:glutathione-specific gamma-glutamylcyclotransferase
VIFIGVVRERRNSAMPTARRQMALTADLVARNARVVEDAGPRPGAVYLTDEDYEIAVRDILAQAPRGDVWLFGYGSLLWKPAFEYVESRMATVRGWHRSFCIRVARFRGTRDLPDLMMALHRGGQCRGKIFRIPADQAVATLNTLFRRELVVKPPGTPPRWLRARTNEGPLLAIGFVVDRRSQFHSGGLTPEEVADIVSRAAGHWGSCAEYLHNTISHLEALGIHDRNLWRLQALVAERLASSPPQVSASLLERVSEAGSRLPS